MNFFSLEVLSVCDATYMDSRMDQPFPVPVELLIEMEIIKVRRDEAKDYTFDCHWYLHFSRVILMNCSADSISMIVHRMRRSENVCESDESETGSGSLLTVSSCPVNAASSVHCACAANNSSTRIAIVRKYRRMWYGEARGRDNREVQWKAWCAQRAYNTYMSYIHTNVLLTYTLIQARAGERVQTQHRGRVWRTALTQLHIDGCIGEI